MKKFMLAVAALFVGAAVFAGSQDITNLGDITDATRYNKIIRVYNPDAVAHEYGDVVVWAVDSTYTVAATTTTTANAKGVAGVVWDTAGIAANSWGYILVYGYHPAIQMAEDSAVGDCLGTSTTAEEAGVTTTAGACFAVSLEAQTSSTTAKGFVQAM